MLFIIYILMIATKTITTQECEKEECQASTKYYVKPLEFQTPHINIDEVYEEIVNGQGYVLIPQAFSKEDIAHARDAIHHLIKKEGNKATHFQGYKDSKPDLQARVWNLLNKGKIWEKFVQHPYIVEIGSRLLGDDFQLGSIATNTIFPGGSGQEPHIDYPYWDYYNKKHWPVPPKVKNVPFHMNMQVTILLDDFTNENGATAVRPGSQLEASFPEDHKEFYKHAKQTTGKSGDMIVFVGLLQHCAMPNKSNSSRTGVIIQYLPKFIRPMEDLKRSVNAEIFRRASPVLKQLLLLDYPYPQLLDEAEAKSTEGVQTIR